MDSIRLHVLNALINIGAIVEEIDMIDCSALYTITALRYMNYFTLRILAKELTKSSMASHIVP